MYLKFSGDIPERIIYIITYEFTDLLILHWTCEFLSSVSYFIDQVDLADVYVVL